MPKNNKYIDSGIQKIEKCHRETKLDSNTCRNLIQEIDNLDKIQDRIWRNNYEIKKVSESLWEKLDKAYNKVGDARDWLREIIGDVD